MPAANCLAMAKAHTDQLTAAALRTLTHYERALPCQMYAAAEVRTDDGNLYLIAPTGKQVCMGRFLLVGPGYVPACSSRGEAGAQGFVWRRGAPALRQIRKLTGRSK